MREISPASKIEEVESYSQKYQELQRMLSEYELIIDRREQFIPRPVDYQEQKRFYYANSCTKHLPL
ncbi:MAG: hypothetical protein V7L26_21860 [Nostoc sp.]|uniref:hypothetical protein n=1 Tax=Nostoc sp. TaxID=1180 RepID=UPI002FF81001